MANDCPICLEPLPDLSPSLVQTACKHRFHCPCLIRALAATDSCPLCRCHAKHMAGPDRHGSRLRFMATLYMTMQAVEQFHCCFLQLGNVTFTPELFAFNRSVSIGLLAIARDFDRQTGMYTEFDVFNLLQDLAFYHAT